MVQASPKSDSRGSLIWLGLESALAVARLGFWALNPAWDDAVSPIVLTKATSETGSSGSSYGVGWTLDSMTANDVHALIVGINKFGGVFEDLTKSVSSAEAVETYLRDTLLVPTRQIVTLTDEDATKDRIHDELKSLSHRAENDAPILIYFSTHSFVDDDGKDAHLAPFYPENAKDDETRNRDWIKKSSISYSGIVELLGRIAEEKTEHTVNRPLTTLNIRKLIHISVTGRLLF